MKRLWSRHKAWLLLTGILPLLMLSCAAESLRATDPARILAGPESAAAYIALPSGSYDDLERNGIVNGAASYVGEGCPGTGLALSGPPTRILTALTSADKASQLLNPEADLYTPPEGLPPLDVRVIAVEGESTSLETGASAGEQTFIFVIDSIDVRYTGCVVRDAPMPIRYSEPATEGFEFEVLLDTK